jgi:DNA-binding transcriptional ArsR family regulator
MENHIKRKARCNVLQPVQLYKILSDETRLAIVLLLRESGELCVCDICGVTAESQPKISRHIAILREAELVLDRREGKWVHYRLSPHACLGSRNHFNSLVVYARGDPPVARKRRTIILLDKKTHSFIHM